MNICWVNNTGIFHLYPVSSKSDNENQKKEDLNGNSNYQPIIRNPFVSNQKRSCEWPIGHPEEQDFSFCRKERFDDKPYCLEHCAIAYVLPDKEEGQAPVNQVA